MNAPAHANRDLFTLEGYYKQKKLLNDCNKNINKLKGFICKRGISRDCEIIASNNHKHNDASLKIM